DARQDRRARASFVEEPVAHEPAGAPRRQVDRRARQRERVGPPACGRKARYQLALDQGADQCRYERFRGRDGEDARNRHAGVYAAERYGCSAAYAALSTMAASAAWTASGVPTCIQTPSRRRP